MLLTRDGSGNAVATGNIVVSGSQISGTTSSLSPFWASEAGGVVTEFEVSPSEVEVGVGSEATLTATVLNMAGQPVQGATVEWSSSLPDVASVSSEGVITGENLGEAEITGTIDDQVATVAVSVVPGAPATIEVSPPAASLRIEDTVSLSALIRDTVGNVVTEVPVSWSSDDEAVAVVDADGGVRGVAVGSTVVRATSGAAEGSSTISVTDATPGEVVILGLPGSIASGDTLTLSAQVLDTEGDEIEGAEVTWTVSDAGILDLFSANEIRANLAGAAEITATAEGGVSATGSITVVPGDAYLVEVLPGEAALDVGQTTALTADVWDRNGNIVSTSLAWASGDEGVATVSHQGVVSGVSEGTTVITAQAGSAAGTATVQVTDATGPAVTFPDPLLEQAVRSALEQPEGDLLASDIAALTQLEYTPAAPNALISDLEGLQYATGLTRLGAQNHAITDLEPLAGLTNLEELYLGNGTLVDVAPLAGLTGLRTLYLWNNSVSDLAPLASLVGLEDLLLQGNEITDISALAGLGSLTWLQLNSNDISDISALSGLSQLTRLNLDGNPIQDLSPIAGATGLTTLGVGFTGVSDISIVEDFTELTILVASGLGLTDSDISVLAGLPLLANLSLQFNQITDISPVQNLTSLRTLNFSGNQVTDLSPVANLVELTQLAAESNLLSDASGVENLTALVFLRLSNNQITDIGPILANTGLGPSNAVFLLNNPLSDTARCEQIPELQARGVTVHHTVGSCQQ